MCQINHGSNSISRALNMILAILNTASSIKRHESQIQDTQGKASTRNLLRRERNFNARMFRAGLTVAIFDQALMSLSDWRMSITKQPCPKKVDAAPSAFPVGVVLQSFGRSSWTRMPCCS